MLVLSRKQQQSIEIGDDVVVQVLKVSGNRVRLGISAPRAKAVKRCELQPLAAAEPEFDVFSPPAPVGME